jgi:hypothetical protein
LVPKCNQERYKDSLGNVFTADIAKDYAKKVLHMITESGAI